MACTSVLTRPSVTPLRVCVCVLPGSSVCVCVCVSDQARREEHRQIDSQKERAASRLSQRLRGLKKKKNRKKERKKMLGVGGWGLDTHPDPGRAPSGGECALPLVQLTPSFFPISPAQAHKHTTGTGINPREDHNRCTQQPPPPLLPAPPQPAPGPIQVPPVTRHPNRD